MNDYVPMSDPEAESIAYVPQPIDHAVLVVRTTAFRAGSITSLADFMLLTRRDIPRTWLRKALGYR